MFDTHGKFQGQNSASKTHGYWLQRASNHLHQRGAGIYILILHRLVEHISVCLVTTGLLLWNGSKLISPSEDDDHTAQSRRVACPFRYKSKIMLITTFTFTTKQKSLYIQQNLQYIIIYIIYTHNSATMHHIRKFILSV